MNEPATPATNVLCAVCGDDAPLAMTAECNWCDQRYHLNQRNDGDAKDCGQVWIDEQFLALQFACFNCLPAEGGDAKAEAPAPGTKPRRYKRRA